MQVFPETLDPGETKDFVFDWTPKLADTETVLSHIVTIIQAAGSTNPSNSLASPLSRVWLSGGNHGERVIWTISAVTSGGKTLEVALAVDIVDSVQGTPQTPKVAELQTFIAEAEARRHEVALGGAVIDAWRDGRRVRWSVTKLSELNEYIATLYALLADAEIAAGGTPSRPRRTAIGVSYI